MLMCVWCVVLLVVLTYCINYKMSPADLVSNWEVYYLNRSAHPNVANNIIVASFAAEIRQVLVTVGR